MDPDELADLFGLGAGHAVGEATTPVDGLADALGFDDGDSDAEEGLAETLGLGDGVAAAVGQLPVLDRAAQDSVDPNISPR